MPPSISRRAFIQWPPVPPSEPTSTLVLTSSEHRFVDIRILKDTSTDHAAVNDRAGKSNASSEQLDWAFAGTSSSKWRDALRGSTVTSEADVESYKPFASSGAAHHADAQPEDRVLHTIWIHTIDSRFRHAEQVKDEGDMLPLPSLGLTLEKGNMRNPATREMADYVEGWVDEEVLPTGSTHEGKKLCVVLEAEDESMRAKGLLVRLGQYYQGILRIGDGITLERCSWHVEHGWTLDVKMGEAAFPTEVAVQGGGWKIGQTVDVPDSRGAQLTWKVIEAEEVKI